MNAVTDECIDNMGNIGDLLTEMRGHGGHAITPETANKWADQLANLTFDLIQMDSHLLGSARWALIKVVEAIHDGKLAAPGNYPSEESRNFVKNLVREIKGVIKEIDDNAGYNDETLKGEE